MAEKTTTIKKKETEDVSTVERTRSSRCFVPLTDIIENEEEIILTADMPGVDQKSIDVTLENNQLTIQGYVKVTIPEEFRLVHTEYDIGDFYRSFTLSDTIDKNKIEASIKNGVLKLRLPKADEVKARKITVN